MASRVATYRKELGLALAAALGTDWQYIAARQHLCRYRGEDADVVSVFAHGKWSPYISPYYYFGRRFAAAAAVEARLGRRAGGYHVGYSSINAWHMAGLTITQPVQWRVDLEAPPKGLPSEMAASIHEIAEPFFARFKDLRYARDAMVANDSWCFSSWESVLVMSVALDDLAPFFAWSARLDAFWQTQISESLARLGLSQGGS